MPKALFWFRWGAVFTVLTGLIYYALLLHTEKIDAKLGIVLVAWIAAWLVVAGLLRMAVAGGPLKDGRVLGIVVAVLVLAASWIVVPILRNGGSNRTMATTRWWSLRLRPITNIRNI